MLSVRVFKYRLYPSLKQRARLVRSCIAAKELWNAMRERRMEHYRATGETLGKYDTDKEFKGHHKELYSQARQNVSERLNLAFQAFFRRCKDPAVKKKGFPKPKKRVNSITYPQLGFKFESERRLVVSKIGRIPIVLHRAPKGTVKNLTLKQDRAGDWWAMLACEVEEAVATNNGEPVGIDLGLNVFAAMSNGELFENPRHLRKSERKLKLFHRRVSRKQKGSKNRRKARFKLAKQYIKVADQRADFQHKLSRKLVTEHKLVAAEDLRVTNMVKNHCLAKSIMDASWGAFLKKMEYKAVTAGSEFLRTNPAYTTLKCNKCGHVKEELLLSERTYRCAECGNNEDRDVNAAKNVLKDCMVGLDRPEHNACGQQTSTTTEASEMASLLKEAGTIRDEN